MNYWALNGAFLLVVAIVAAVALIRDRARLWRPALVGLCILVVFTAIFDNLMIGAGLVGYNPARISGVFIGRAPVEDFAYAIAAAILLPSLWVLLSPREKP